MNKIERKINRTVQLAKNVRLHRADGGETDPMLNQDTSIYNNPYKDQVLSAPEPMTMGQYLAQAMRKPHETNIRDFPQDFQNLAVVQGIKNLPSQMWEAVKYPGMALKGELQRGIDPHTGQVTGVTESGMGPTEAGMVGAGLMSTGALPDLLAGKVTPNITRIFAGEKAATADLTALEKAKSMLEQGHTPSQIIKETGWFQGPDEKWRFEIPDRGAKIVAQKGKFSHILLDENGEYHGLMPNTVLGNEGIMEHQKLLEAYPQLAKVDLAQVDFPSNAVQGAYQSPTWNDYSLSYSDPKIYLSNDAKYPRSTLLHELQHAVQDIENFPRGSSSKLAKTIDDYKNAAGEVEARNVQSRGSFTPEEIKSKLPWETQDTPYNKQIVSYKNPTYDESYKGQHEAPMKDSGAPLYNVSGVYPKDFYGYNGFKYYADFGDKMDRQTYNIIQDSLARPNKSITIYRAVPNDPDIKFINKGDWVTINRNYAKDHGESALNGDYKIITKKVFARDLYTAGDSHHEWGYDPQPYINMNKNDKLSMKKDVRGYDEGGRVGFATGGSIGNLKMGKNDDKVEQSVNLAKELNRSSYAYGGFPEYTPSYTLDNSLFRPTSPIPRGMAFSPVHILSKPSSDIKLPQPMTPYFNAPGATFNQPKIIDQTPAPGTTSVPGIVSPTVVSAAPSSIVGGSESDSASLPTIASSQPPVDYSNLTAGSPTSPGPFSPVGPMTGPLDVPPLSNLDLYQGSPIIPRPPEPTPAPTTTTPEDTTNDSGQQWEGGGGGDHGDYGGGVGVEGGTESGTEGGGDGGDGGGGDGGGGDGGGGGERYGGAITMRRYRANGGPIRVSPRHAEAGPSKVSPAQAKAGNYKKKHLNFQGLPLSIETPKGHVREKIINGKLDWRVKMPVDYGYVKGTKDHDGDASDVFVGPHKKSDRVWVIDQANHQTGKFDEHKAMLGFKHKHQALKAYKDSFSDGKGHKRIMDATKMSVQEYKDWIKHGDLKKPVSSSPFIQKALMVASKKS